VLNLCLPTCLPLAPTCAAGDLCAPWEDEFFCLPDGADDSGAFGEPCEGVNMCDAGLFCANADVVPACASDTCCTELCDITVQDPDTQCTGAGQQCLPWFDDGEAPTGYENLGACALPN
jgi:hypothetical protein